MKHLLAIALIAFLAAGCSDDSADDGADVSTGGDETSAASDGTDDEGSEGAGTEDDGMSGDDLFPVTIGDVTIEAASDIRPRAQAYSASAGILAAGDGNQEVAEVKPTVSAYFASTGGPDRSSATPLDDINRIAGDVTIVANSTAEPRAIDQRAKPPTRSSSFRSTSGILEKSITPIMISAMPANSQ